MRSVASAIAVAITYFQTGTDTFAAAWMENRTVLSQQSDKLLYKSASKALFLELDHTVGLAKTEGVLPMPQ